MIPNANDHKKRAGTPPSMEDVFSRDGDSNKDNRPIEETTRPIHVRIDNEIFDRLDWMRYKTKLTYRQLIQQALDEYLTAWERDQSSHRR